MNKDLQRPFALVVIDAALSPEIPEGSVVRLDPALKPKAGRPVLVKDRKGNYYLRDYQSGLGDDWQAVARWRGFASLDSERDGLSVVAVMKGFDYPD